MRQEKCGSFCDEKLAKEVGGSETDPLELGKSRIKYVGVVGRRRFKRQEATRSCESD